MGQPFFYLLIYFIRNKKTAREGGQIMKNKQNKYKSLKQRMCQNTNYISSQTFNNY